MEVAHAVRAAAGSMDRARRIVLGSGQVLRALQAAGGVVALLVWLRSGRRPPALLLFSLSLPLLRAMARKTSPSALRRA